jgi:hypothetical protein
MVDTLRTKDNQVFLDYLAGGQSRQISQEREANAVSISALNVAARNAVATTMEGGNHPQALQESLVAARELSTELKLCDELTKLIPGVAVIQESITAFRALVGEVGHYKEAYVDMSNTKLEMEAKLHSQEREHAKEKMEMTKAKLELEVQFHELAKAKAEHETSVKNRNIEMDDQIKKNEADHQVTLSKIKLDHEAGLARLRVEEQDRTLERDVKRAKLINGNNNPVTKKSRAPSSMAVVGGLLRRSTRIRKTRY